MVLAQLRAAVVGSTRGLFSHGPQPLVRTLDYAGDPGLLGPESISWQVIGDAAAFVAGIRALIVQTAHPEVVAGVEQHSSYQTDPLGRLTRTSAYVTETTYGAMPEVKAAVATVRRAHGPVRGRSDRKRSYSASDPALMAWVHNVLTDSFLVAHNMFGRRRLSTAESDRFVDEQARIGTLLGADPLPSSAAALSSWIVEHPELERSAAQRQAIRFLRNPPLPLGVKVGYCVLFNAAVATLPPEICRLTGLHPFPGSREIGRTTVAALRWALGSSPSWHLALVRCGADIPEGLFHQALEHPPPQDVPAAVCPV